MDIAEVDPQLTLVTPPSVGPRRPGVVLMHAMPTGLIPASHVGTDLPELCERIATEMGFFACTGPFRGTSTREGQFSLAGWVDDGVAMVEAFRRVVQPDDLWLVGFGTGGAVAASVALAVDGVRGIALIGTPSDFANLPVEPEKLLRYARRRRLITDESYPANPQAWQEEFQAITASSAVEQLGDRELLVLHGADDDVVPQLDARLLAELHGDAELRILAGAGHQLRHDPRAMAVLLGWLDRQRYR